MTTQALDPATGLDRAQVAERIEAGQVNKAPQTPGRTVPQILRANILTRFNAILGALFVVVVIIGPPLDALFGVVLVVNAAFGVFTELRAKRALDQLAILTAPRARVIRDGEVAEIAVADVVQDDVLDLRSGDQITVDANILTGNGLEVDEALLTGEAEPVPKAAGDAVLSGSFIVAGDARARSAKIGGDAYAAQLQQQARRFSLIRSELQQGTNQILRLVTWVMIPTAVLLIISEFFRSHEPLLNAIRGSAAGLVAMVPEGLVLLTSLAFTAGAMRLARSRVLVQELAAVEGLARVDVLCVDKTGTLTRPGMRVMDIEVVGGWPGERVAEVIGAIATNEVPNATMASLAAAFPSAPAWQVTGQVPFSSARKWSAMAFDGHGAWYLGAPSILGRGALPAAVADAVAGHESAGQRVLLLAGSKSPVDGELPPDVTPAALVILAEELRDETAPTVSYLLSQDVTIVVLSGDAPRSVAAIAGLAGIPVSGTPVDAGALTAEAIGAELAQTNVLGRVRPEHKVAAVKALQAQGHVVAMIGDGVNDVPALKQADLGIAMGSGSQASRAVARVVLLDSTFAALPRVLDEGRRVIANIERVARLFVTKTGYAAIIAISVGIAGIAYPFFPRHLTIISTLTIGVPGFFLALARGAPRASSGFTRRVLEFAIPAGIAVAFAGLAAYLVARAEVGGGFFNISTADTSQQATVRTATLLAVFAVAMWVLALVAGRPVIRAVVLVIVMTGGLAGLFAVPIARREFELRLPSVSVCLWCALFAAIAILALTAWRAFATRELRFVRASSVGEQAIRLAAAMGAS